MQGADAPPAVEVALRGVTFYAAIDEAMLFAWIDRLGCVREARGVGTAIRLSLDPSRLGTEEARGLLACFHRYGADMRPLQALEPLLPKGWLRNQAAWWHAPVFGTGAAGTASPGECG